MFREDKGLFDYSGYNCCWRISKSIISGHCLSDLSHFKDLHYNLDLRNNCHVLLGYISCFQCIYTVTLTCDLKGHGHICVSWFRFFQHIKTIAFMFQCRKLELPLNFTESLKHCNNYVPSYYVEHYETLMSRGVYIRKMKLFIFFIDTLRNIN